ncbi:hypothetical protein NKH28_26120 [Mesorhizobium sp. M1227]|uniref:ABC-three component system protein n=1 Tax=Mesorhizobium sp. M1227 TaxID=2957071 RepID=UPI003335BAB7
MSVEDMVRPVKTSAPGQYLGYAVQPVRFCYHLLRAAHGELVSLEYMDDVAIHRPSGQVALEQCKSSIRPKLITDKSIDLWKTFGNWVDICAAHGLEPGNTEFILYVAPGEAGPIVEALHAANTDDAANAIITKLKSWLTPSTVGKGFGEHLQRFLVAGDPACAAIIKKFRFDAETDPLDRIREILRATITESAVNDFCSAAIGRAKEDAERLIRDGKSPVVDAQAFRRRFQAFVRKHNLAGLLNSTTAAPGTADIEKTIASAPMFVRQLEAVELTPELIVGAVSACLRSTADKIKWAADGDIVEDSLDEFDAGLQQRFSLVRDEVEDLHAAHDPKKRGRLVYRRCATVQMPLEGRTLPNHFVEGAYNDLANDLRVGWHPSYQDILGKNWA